MKLKIYVYAICKDEELFADRWMDSVSEADGVYVLDTGSSDGTVEKLRGRGARVTSREIVPWRFDAARNFALGAVPDDADICVCADLDEVFDPGWRGKLEDAWTPGTTDARYIMNFDFEPDGAPRLQYYIGKAHSRSGFYWKWPCHEYLVYDSHSPQNTVTVPDLYISHYPDRSKVRGSYLPLLELGAREYPADARMAYYLGREYMYEGRWQDCIDTLSRYPFLSGAWPEECCAAMRHMAKSYEMLGRRDRALACYHRAISECPGLREPYVEAAKLAGEENDWPAVYYFAEAALRIREKAHSFINEAEAWDHTPHLLAARACRHFGVRDKLAFHAGEALKTAPEDLRLQVASELAADLKASIYD